MASSARGALSAPAATATPLRSIYLKMVIALALALAVAVALPATAFAFDGPKQDAYNAQTATGATDDPFKILVTKLGDPEQTRPSAFWSGAGINAAGGTNTITPFAVSFEQRVGDTVDGALISSMTFDMHTSLHEGIPTYGLVLSDTTPVWNIEKPTWTYAFRLAPYSAQDTSTGDLRISFGWHGCFATYFDDWEYAFDAVSATASLAEGKQAHPGDIVTLTYYGGYEVDQTSRGTNYVCNFDETATSNTTVMGIRAEGDPVGTSVSAVVDEDGIARFSGPNVIRYGGNYAVSVAPRPVEIEFPDVAGDEWYAVEGVVRFATAAGFVTGVETDSGEVLFAGDESVTRAMFATMLYRLAGSPEAAGESFPDVPEGAWYAEEAAWARAAGVVTGVETDAGESLFAGDRPITREEAALMLMRFAEASGCDVSARADLAQAFPGEQASPWASDAASWAVACGIVTGKTGGERPVLDAQGTATRAEACAMIMRLVAGE